MQNIIILDQDFPMRPNNRQPNHWYFLINNYILRSVSEPVFNRAVSILWNSSLQQAALDLPQELSYNVPWSSICLFHTALSKIISDIKSQWRVWKSASVEIILIDPNDPEKQIQFKRTGRGYLLP